VIGVRAAIAILASLGVCLGARTALASDVYTDTSEVRACLTQGGATFAATRGGVVVTKDGTTRVLTVLDGLPDTRAYALLATADGVWVGTERGAVELSARLEVQRAALDASVRAFASWNGVVLAGTFGRGIADLTHGTFLATPDARVLSLATFGGTLYAGTMSGVVERSGSGFAVRTAEPAFDLSVDAAGVHASVAPKTAACAVASSGMPSNDVSAIAADDRSTWVGTFDRGLARLDADGFHAIAGVDARIDALALDRKRARLWVGTARGLYAVDGGSDGACDGNVGHVVVGGDEVHALAALEGGGVLAGTGHGALIVDRAGAIARLGSKQGVELPSVTAVLEREGTLFLGTTGGLFVGRGRRFERLSVASGHLPDDWVTALASSGDAIYAGTYNAGVVRLEKHGHWQAQRMGGGFVNPAGLGVDGDALYVATMDGLWTSTRGSPLARRERGALGPDVTGIAVSSRGTYVASRRGVLRL
jgi:ligand-binding sensor domain-containing protein